MKLGSQVIDSARPEQVGVFNGYAMKDGVRYAKVKFGKSLIVAPERRISLKTKPVGVPNQKRPKPKVDCLSVEEYAVLLDQYGITPEEAQRRARATGSSLAEVFEAFTEICPAK